MQRFDELRLDHKSRNKFFIVLPLAYIAGLLCTFTGSAYAATCYGNDPCRACHTCEYCGHCNSGGNPCGVLRAERGQSRPSPAVRHTAPARSVKQHPAILDSSVPKSYFSNYRPYRDASSGILPRQGVRIARPASPTLVAPEPSPVPSIPVGITTTPITFSNPSQAPGPPCIWQLQVTPSAVSGMPQSMVHFYHWSDMQKPGVIDTWDKWAKGLMHIVYADVSATPGQKSMFEDYLIYVRSDKKIMMKTSGYSNSKNLELLRAAVDRLNGREELAFPTPLVADTVFISGQIAFAPERISRDVWGRPEPKEKSNWNQYAW